MIRALKWAYDLGTRQERVRIASHLQLETTYRTQRGNNLRDEIPYSVRDKKDEKKAKRLVFEKVVNEEVSSIIQAILEPKGDWIPGPSIMFPNDKHKGDK